MQTFFLCRCCLLLAACSAAVVVVVCCRSWGRRIQFFFFTSFGIWLRMLWDFQCLRYLVSPRIRRYLYISLFLLLFQSVRLPTHLYLYCALVVVLYIFGGVLLTVCYLYNMDDSLRCAVVVLYIYYIRLTSMR